MLTFCFAVLKPSCIHVYFSKDFLLRLLVSDCVKFDVQY